MLGSKAYDKQVDTWSLACIIAEMINGRALFGGYSTRSDNAVLWNQMKVLGMPTKCSDPEIGQQPRYPELVLDSEERKNLTPAISEMLNVTPNYSVSEASTAVSTPRCQNADRFSEDVNGTSPAIQNPRERENYCRRVDQLSAEQFFFDKQAFLSCDIIEDDDRKKNLKKLLFGPYYSWKRTQMATSNQPLAQQQPKPEFLVCKEAGCCCVQYFKYALVEGRKEQKLSQRDIVGDQESVTDLLLKMLEFDQKTRYTCSEALAHPYLNGFV